MFGAVNALFSGMAFAALIYTVLLQRRELQLQREELIETREEIKGQKLQLVAQNDVLRQQTFEQTFFQTLSLLNALVTNITMGTVEAPVVGRDCFRRLYRFYGKNAKDDTDVESLSRNYIAFYGRYGYEIGHYFRTLYNLVKLVDRSAVEDKRFYTNIIRAQLSDQELGLLFYNCLSPLGNEKFKPMVEKYALLKNMPTGTLLNPAHKLFYLPSAFGDT